MWISYWCTNKPIHDFFQSDQLSGGLKESYAIPFPVKFFNINKMYFHDKNYFFVSDVTIYFLIIGNIGTLSWYIVSINFYYTKFRCKILYCKNLNFFLQFKAITKFVLYATIELSLYIWWQSLNTILLPLICK